MKKEFNLANRTYVFSKECVLFAKSITDNLINHNLIYQFIKSSTSIGANYMEADCAESRKDFMHKIGICKKESKETTYWLKIIGDANPDKLEICQRLWKESHELTLIFSTITKNK